MVTSGEHHSSTLGEPGVGINKQMEGGGGVAADGFQDGNVGCERNCIYIPRLMRWAMELAGNEARYTQVFELRSDVKQSSVGHRSGHARLSSRACSRDLSVPVTLTRKPEDQRVRAMT